MHGQNHIKLLSRLKLQELGGWDSSLEQTNSTLAEHQHSEIQM